MPDSTASNTLTTIGDLADQVAKLSTDFETTYNNLTDKVNAVGATTVKTENAVGAVQQQQAATIASATATNPLSSPLVIGGALILGLFLILKK